MTLLTRSVAHDVLPSPCGPRSLHARDLLAGLRAPIPDIWDDPLTPDDRDGQLALWMLEVSRTAHFDEVTDEAAGSIAVAVARHRLEAVFEDDLRRRFPVPAITSLATHVDAVRARLRPATASVDGRDPDGRDAVLARFLAKAPYLAWEADPHTLTLAHVERPLKTSLADIQSGEYGVGHGSVHADIYRSCLDAVGVSLLDALEGSPAEAFAAANATWLFGADPRLRGASVGQLVLFETDSVGPCRTAVASWDRAGLPAAGRRWYDVHVLADEVHDRVIRDELIPAVEIHTPHLVPDAVWGIEVTDGLAVLLTRALARP